MRKLHHFARLVAMVTLSVLPCPGGAENVAPSVEQFILLDRLTKGVLARVGAGETAAIDSSRLKAGGMAVQLVLTPGTSARKVAFYSGRKLIRVDSAPPFAALVAPSAGRSVTITAVATVTVGAAMKKIRGAVRLAPAANGDGDATPGFERWSDPATWAGSPPAGGREVTIPEGKRVLLDVDTPELGGLVVNGVLQFDDSKDVALTSRWILVSGAGSLFRAGSAARPYRRRATITLTGTDENENVKGLELGTKGLYVLNGGVLDLHGVSREKRSWTLLTKSAAPGDTSISVADASGWEVGDAIALAPSGFDPFDAEDVRITAISGNRISFTPALESAHWGSVQQIEGVAVDQRAEVALLTRNIVIQGAEDSEANSFGGHVMVGPGGMARVEGVEFFRMGQMGHAARYPLHWHHVDRHSRNGVKGAGQYARRNSVHDSYQRAFVIHGTNNILLEENAAYDCFNHQYILSEDGDEVGNIALRNVAILAKTPPRFSFDGPKGSEQNEDESSNFWMRNARQYVIGNRAAGAEQGNNFSYDLEQSTVKEAGKMTTVGYLEDNVGHSTTNQFYFATHMYHTVRGFGVGTNVGYEGPRFLYIRRNHFYKHAGGGMWLDNEEYARDNLISDSTSSAHVQHAQMQGNTVVGFTANKLGEDGQWSTEKRQPRTYAFGVNYTFSFRRAMKSVDDVMIGTTAGGFVVVDVLTFGNAAMARRPVFKGSGAVPFGNDEKVTYWAGDFFDADGSISGTGKPTVVTEKSMGSASSPNSAGVFLTPLESTELAKITIESPGDGESTSDRLTVKLRPYNLKGRPAPVVLTVDDREYRIDGSTTTSVEVKGLQKGWHVARLGGAGNDTLFGSDAIDRVYFHVGKEPKISLPRGRVETLKRSRPKVASSVFGGRTPR